MIKLITITSEEMKAIDTYCIESLGIPGIVLMENAALKVIKNIDLEKHNSFLIVCSVGNNGGDGLAIARHLIVEGKNVEIFILGKLNNGSKDFKTNYNILKNIDADIFNISKESDLDVLRNSLRTSDIVIDSIFGTGLTRNVEGLFEKTISLINEESQYIISVDIPSGLSANTGNILGISIKANKTITFQLMKKGLVEHKAKDYVGEAMVGPIGMPQIAIHSVLSNLKIT